MASKALKSRKASPWKSSIEKEIVTGKETDCSELVDPTLHDVMQHTI